MKKRFFDDYIFYDPRTNRIWIGRPATKTSGEPWQWFMLSADRVMRPHGKPKHMIEIGRDSEFALC